MTNVPAGIRHNPNQMTKGSINAVCMKNRQKVISNGPCVAPSSLANTSRNGIMSMPAHICAAPMACLVSCATDRSMPASCTPVCRAVNHGICAKGEVAVGI